MQVQLVLTSGNKEAIWEFYHSEKTIKVQIFNDFGKMVHACEFCIECLGKRAMDRKNEVIYREDFSTGNGVVCEKK